MDPLKLQTIFNKDEYIYREGDPADCVYIVDAGQVQVLLERNDTVIVTEEALKKLGEVLAR